jgi:hypothetical protein
MRRNRTTANGVSSEAEMWLSLGNEFHEVEHVFYVLDLATMSFVAELKRRTRDFGVAPIFL